MPPSTKPFHELYLTGRDGKTRIIRMEMERITVGRSAACELCYPDDSGLSRQHLAFERQQQEWRVRDLGSKNGTWVNGVRLENPHGLRRGDRVAAGHLIMVFDDPASAATGAVVFVEEPEVEPQSSSTVITDLHGVLEAAPGTLRVAALIKAGRELTGGRSLEELFQFILDLSIEAVNAERAALLVVEGENLVLKSAKGGTFRISATVRDRVLRGESVLVRDVLKDDDFRLRASIVEQQIRSLMAVPLQTEDRVIGLVYVDSPQLIREFTREDLNLLTVMANIAASRIEHTRLAEVEAAERQMAHDMERAAEIQRQFLPAQAPTIAGFDVAGHNASCRTVGGDYYDFVVRDDGKVALALGDVSGKGMPAALLMSNLQAKFQVLAEEGAEPSVMVSRLNRAMVRACPSNCFVTFFYCAVDPASGGLEYSNAGHNPPIIVRTDNSVETLETGGTVLGMLPFVSYQQGQSTLGIGDVLVIYSDGVTEAVNQVSDEFGEERLIQVIRANFGCPAEAIIQAIDQAIRFFAGGAPPADDLTLVVAKRTG